MNGVSGPVQHAVGAPAGAPRSGAAPRRRFGIWAVLALLLFGFPIFVFAAGAATVAATGFVTVHVEEKGAEAVHVPVPALLLDLAAFAVPRLIDDADRAEVRRVLGPHEEALRAFADSIEDGPEVTFVEVRAADGSFTAISRQGSKLVVEIQDDETDIHVSIPSRFVGRALDAML